MRKKEMTADNLPRRINGSTLSGFPARARARRDLTFPQPERNLTTGIRT
jgi:hypothetical protein